MLALRVFQFLMNLPVKDPFSPCTCVKYSPGARFSNLLTMMFLPL